MLLQNKYSWINNFKVKENLNLEFSSGELRIEVHLSTTYIQKLRILGPHIKEENFSLRGVLYLWDKPGFNL